MSNTRPRFKLSGLEALKTALVATKKQHQLEGNEISIIPGLYLGSLSSALNETWLKQAGITHVLSLIGDLPICLPGVDHKHICIQDRPQENMSIHFNAVHDWMVHCEMGISRSATMVCSYLMNRLDLSFQEALDTVWQYRKIHPNSGFLRQLKEYCLLLRNSRKSIVYTTLAPIFLSDSTGFITTGFITTGFNTICSVLQDFI
jgi:protein-tyrosine phosphatase